MKSTGIVRRIDDLGRVVIPKEIRRELRIREGDPLELFREGSAICFKKYDTTPNVRSCITEIEESLIEGSVKDCLSSEEVSVIKSALGMLKSKLPNEKEEQK